ncbi:hypothetical protein LPB85_01895 [Chryseobacterium sp. LC2016-27]|jgi:hypothetical protein|uniref:hypothetical protein n=1 Tax=Chryseobacterium sp. LC2016-27 TaxID=2897326 RepID=UPI001E35E285|nr:hypothetical protein [Chryseobacterium sp. LC2016-27]MCD0454196.1 hypothetical protein [Chryseobacterium sp. LC2016-27]
MLTEQEIIEIAKNYVLDKSQQSGYDLVILDNEEIKKPYGIIFRYNTKKFNQTRDINDNTLFGNVPFLVKNNNGKIVTLGSPMGLDYCIKKYEEGKWPETPRLSDFQ